MATPRDAGLLHRFSLQQTVLLVLGTVLIVLPNIGWLDEIIIVRNDAASTESRLYSGWGAVMIFLAVLRWRLRHEWFRMDHTGIALRFTKISPEAIAKQDINGTVRRALLNVNMDGIDPNGRR